LKPDPTRQDEPGLELGLVEEKTGERKTQCDPTDPNPVKNPAATR